MTAHTSAETASPWLFSRQSSFPQTPPCEFSSLCCCVCLVPQSVRVQDVFATHRVQSVNPFVVEYVGLEFQTQIQLHCLILVLVPCSSPFVVGKQNTRGTYQYWPVFLSTKTLFAPMIRTFGRRFLGEAQFVNVVSVSFRRELCISGTQKGYWI